MKRSPLKTTQVELEVRDHRIVLYIRTDQPKKRSEVLAAMKHMLASHKRVSELRTVSISTGLDAPTIKEQMDTTFNKPWRTTLGNLRCAGGLHQKVKDMLKKYVKLPDTVVVWIRGTGKGVKCGLVKNKKTGKPIHYRAMEVNDDVPF